MTPNPIAMRDIIKLNTAEHLMREVMFAPEVSRWFQEAVPELLEALEKLDKARIHLHKPIEVKDA